MMKIAQTAYDRSPAWLQNLLMSAFGVRLHFERYGRDFARLSRLWNESERWDHDRAADLQNVCLRGILEVAATIPFYQRWYAEAGVNWSQIQSSSDLAKLPVMTKERVRNAGPTLCAPHAHHLRHGHTSGTTGSPLSLWYDRRMVVANTVADWRQKTWAGMTRRDWCGVFLGRVIVPTSQRHPPFWRVNHVQRQVWFSSFHMSASTLDTYCAEIKRRGLAFLEGYPSTMYILARHVVDAGGRLPMRAVLTSSETLHPLQRETIERAFACQVFDYFGHAERVVFAGECESHHGKHNFDEYGIVEVVDDDGRQMPAGQQGWLLGTTLWNRGMPLIRYRGGDLSAIDTSPCACGRTLTRISAVTTKAEDIVVTPDGRLVSPSVLTHPFKPFPSIRKSQIIQTAPDHVQVFVVAGEGLGPAELELLKGGLAERLGGAVTIEVQVVDDIPPEPSGKFRWVKSAVRHECSVEWGGGVTDSTP